MTHKIAIEALTRYAPSPLPFNISPVASGEYVLLPMSLPPSRPRCRTSGAQLSSLRDCGHVHCAALVSVTAQPRANSILIRRAAPL